MRVEQSQFEQFTPTQSIGMITKHAIAFKRNGNNKKGWKRTTGKH
jgi:hypothetical protein